MEEGQCVYYKKKFATKLRREKNKVELNEGNKLPYNCYWRFFFQVTVEGYKHAILGAQ